MNFNSDIFDPNLSFSIEEASEVDGKHILGKIKGCFFVPDGVSRNNRFYPKSLWEKALNSPDVKSALSDRRMFGTISHDQAINDNSIADGRISHIVTKLWIEGDKGMGEALILDTPTGRVLNTLMRAGTKLYVSSRANGTFKGQQGGIPSVDPELYELRGFDVVLDPGFLQANPSLVESLNKLLADSNPETILTNSKEESQMDMKEIIESISKENASLKLDLDKAVKELTDLRATNESLTEKNEMIAKLQADLDACLAKLSKFDTIGTHEEIEKAFDTAEDLLSRYKELGSPEEIADAFAKTEELVNRLKELGNADEIEEALDKAIFLITQYSKLGTAKQVEEAFDSASSLIKEYKELGSPKDISEALSVLEKQINEKKNIKETEKVAKLAESLNVPVAAIKEVYGKMDEKSIRKLFSHFSKVEEANNEQIVEAPIAAPVIDVVENFVKKDTATKEIPAAPLKNESKTIVSKSRGERLFEAFMR